jgi:hypothetical protein
VDRPTALLTNRPIDTRATSAKPFKNTDFTGHNVPRTVPNQTRRSRVEGRFLRQVTSPRWARPQAARTPAVRRPPALHHRLQRGVGHRYVSRHRTAALRQAALTLSQSRRHRRVDPQGDQQHDAHGGQHVPVPAINRRERNETMAGNRWRDATVPACFTNCSIARSSTPFLER